MNITKNRWISFGFEMAYNIILLICAAILYVDVNERFDTIVSPRTNDVNS
jgi:hypothetical protein